jgi:hypothetical protein
MTRNAYYRSGLLFVGTFFLAVTGWAKVYTMQATPIVPGAVATVDAKVDKNGGNTQVTVKAERLAKPTLLTPSATSYVVWLQDQGGQPMNQGELRIGDDQKGELKMTTTASHFSVFITAENDPKPKSPSNRVVLRSDVQE